MEDTDGIFDAEALRASLDGDDELFDELVDLFADDAPKQLAAYASALAAGDQRTAERAAHTLKGAAANLCAVRIRDRAAAAEALCRANDLAAAVEAMPGLEEAVAATLRLMYAARSS